MRIRRPPCAVTGRGSRPRALRPRLIVWEGALRFTSLVVDTRERRGQRSSRREILMAAYQAGNEAAFRELFERYAGRACGFLVRRLGDPSLAEDLYQEAFFRIHRARSSYDSNRSFRAWLFGIVHNLPTDTLRSHRRTAFRRTLRRSPPGGATSRERAGRGCRGVAPRDPMIYLQSAPFTSGVIASWLAGTAVGTACGGFGALRVRNRVALVSAPA